MNNKNILKGYQNVKIFRNFTIEVPDFWETRKFGSFTKEINLRFSNDKQGPVLSVTKHRGFVESLEYFKKQIYSKDIKKYKLVKKGDFAYATIHLDEGSLGLLKNFEYGYISPMYTVFRIDNTVNPDFLFILLKSHLFLQIYRAMGEGSINRRKTISFEDLSELNIPMPIIAEQKKIASIINILDEKINLLERIKINTETMKKGLIQQLLTGKIMVKV